MTVESTANSSPIRPVPPSYGLNEGKQPSDFIGRTTARLGHLIEAVRIVAVRVYHVTASVVFKTINLVAKNEGLHQQGLQHWTLATRDGLSVRRQISQVIQPDLIDKPPQRAPSQPVNDQPRSQPQPVRVVENTESEDDAFYDVESGFEDEPEEVIYDFEHEAQAVDTHPPVESPACVTKPTVTDSSVVEERPVDTTTDITATAKETVTDSADKVKPSPKKSWFNVSNIGTRLLGALRISSKMERTLEQDLERKKTDLIKSIESSMPTGAGLPKLPVEALRVFKNHVERIHKELLVETKKEFAQMLGEDNTPGRLNIKYQTLGLQYKDKLETRLSEHIKDYYYICCKMLLGNFFDNTINLDFRRAIDEHHSENKKLPKFTPDEVNQYAAFFKDAWIATAREIKPQYQKDTVKALREGFGQFYDQVQAAYVARARGDSPSTDILRLCDQFDSKMRILSPANLSTHGRKLMINNKPWIQIFRDLVVDAAVKVNKLPKASKQKYCYEWADRKAALAEGVLCSMVDYVTNASLLGESKTAAAIQGLAVSRQQLEGHFDDYKTWSSLIGANRWFTRKWVQWTKSQHVSSNGSTVSDIKDKILASMPVVAGLAFTGYRAYVSQSWASSLVDIGITAATIGTYRVTSGRTYLGPIATVGIPAALGCLSGSLPTALAIPATNAAVSGVRKATNAAVSAVNTVVDGVVSKLTWSSIPGFIALGMAGYQVYNNPSMLVQATADSTPIAAWANLMLPMAYIWSDSTTYQTLTSGSAAVMSMSYFKDLTSLTAVPSLTAVSPSAVLAVGGLAVTTIKIPLALKAVWNYVIGA